MKWEPNERGADKKDYEPEWYLVNDNDQVVAWLLHDDKGWWWATFAAHSHGPFETKEAAMLAAEMLFNV